MEDRLWHQHYDFNVQTEYRHPQFSTYQLLNQAANVQPDKAAVNYYGATMTFHELKQKVLSLATMFEKMGIQKGTASAFTCPTFPSTLSPFMRQAMWVPLWSTLIPCIPWKNWWH